MGAFPPLPGLLLRCILILAVGQHIEELHGRFRPHLIPGAAHRFAGPVYIGNPAPIP